MLYLIDSGYDLFFCRHAVAGCGAASMLGIRGEVKQLLIEKVVNVSGLLGQSKGACYSGMPGLLIAAIAHSTISVLRLRWYALHAPLDSGEANHR
jgi:ABC-type cobalamin transport system permease subunit